MKKYPKHVYRLALLPGLVLCFGSFVYAAESLSTTALLDSKAWTLSVYGRGAKTKPVVSVSGTDSVSVPVSGGSSAVFSSADADLEFEQTEEDLMLALNFKPYDGLTYSLYAGQIQDYKLEFSSGSQTNSLRSASDGWRMGLGLSGTLVPLSPVSTGVTWSAAYFQSHIDLDRFQGGDVVYAIDEVVKQQEFQGSLQATRRWKDFEPYVGLKLIRVVTRLEDKVSKQRVSGHTEGISPFVGLRWAMFAKEFLQVEGSFVDEKSVTAGFVVQF